MAGETPFAEGKNVSMVGFGKLAEIELETIKQIMPVYIKKLESRTDYTELKIRLKMHQHAKSFIHELDADLFMPGSHLGAKITHKNLYKALALAMSKLLAEVEHHLKKKARQHPIRKFSGK